MSVYTEATIWISNESSKNFNQFRKQLSIKIKLKYSAVFSFELKTDSEIFKMSILKMSAYIQDCSDGFSFTGMRPRFHDLNRVFILLGSTFL